MAGAWQLGKRDFRVIFGKQVIFNSIPALRAALLTSRYPQEPGGVWKQRVAERFMPETVLDFTVL